MDENMSKRCPPLGVKRTSPEPVAKYAFDPKRMWAVRALRPAVERQFMHSDQTSSRYMMLSQTSLT